MKIKHDDIADDNRAIDMIGMDNILFIYSYNNGGQITIYDNRIFDNMLMTNQHNDIFSFNDINRKVNTLPVIKQFIKRSGLDIDADKICSDSMEFTYKNLQRYFPNNTLPISICLINRYAIDGITMLIYNLFLCNSHFNIALNTVELSFWKRIKRLLILHKFDKSAIYYSMSTNAITINYGNSQMIDDSIQACWKLMLLILDEDYVMKAVKKYHLQNALIDNDDIIGFYKEIVVAALTIQHIRND